MPSHRIEIMPWCPRCETWHDSLEDHYDEIEAYEALDAQS